MSEVNFKENWLETVDKRETILCAGVDPSEYSMGRSERGEGLPDGVNKRDWALKYIEAIAPFVAAIKPNVRYWGAEEDNKTLKEIAQLGKSLGLITIQDSKEADIGSTNDAGIFYAADRGYDFVTLAAFAGNVEEAAKQAKQRNIGLIGMCLMSNPEYATVKNQLVDVHEEDEEAYAPRDFVALGGRRHVPKYIQLAREAELFGLEGIVVGAPSSKNHIKPQELAKVREYFGGDGLILVPGIGAQGGEIYELLKNFGYNHMIANVGRSMMFPKGMNSNPQEQAEAAKIYNSSLRDVFKKVMGLS